MYNGVRSIRKSSEGGSIAAPVEERNNAITTLANSDIFGVLGRMRRKQLSISTQAQQEQAGGFRRKLAFEGIPGLRVKHHLLV